MDFWPGFRPRISSATTPSPPTTARLLGAVRNLTLQVPLLRFSVLWRGFELPLCLPPRGNLQQLLPSGSSSPLVLLASCLIGFLVLGPPSWGTLVPTLPALGLPLWVTLVPTLSLPCLSADRTPRLPFLSALSTVWICAVALRQVLCLRRLVPKGPGVRESGQPKCSRAAGPPHCHQCLLRLSLFVTLCFTAAALSALLALVPSLPFVAPLGKSAAAIQCCIPSAPWPRQEFTATPPAFPFPSLCRDAALRAQARGGQPWDALPPQVASALQWSARPPGLVPSPAAAAWRIYGVCSLAASPLHLGGHLDSRPLRCNRALSPGGPGDHRRGRDGRGAPLGGPVLGPPLGPGREHVGSDDPLRSGHRPGDNFFCGGVSSADSSSRRPGHGSRQGLGGRRRASRQARVLHCCRRRPGRGLAKERASKEDTGSSQEADHRASAVGAGVGLGKFAPGPCRPSQRGGGPTKCFGEGGTTGRPSTASGCKEWCHRLLRLPFLCLPTRCISLLLATAPRQKRWEPWPRPCLLLRKSPWLLLQQLSPLSLF